MIRTDGKVYEIVRAKLEAIGLETSTLKIATFGRHTYHEIVLHGSIVGSYEHISGESHLHGYEAADN